MRHDEDDDADEGDDDGDNNDTNIVRTFCITLCLF